MRLTELSELRREYVRLEQGVIMLPKAKAGARAVVLSGSAAGILQQQLAKHGSGWVFPNRDGRPYTRVHVSRVFRKAARAAGLADFRFHDLRHHGATMALNAGFSAPIVMALGGWKTERMMRRYAAVTDQTLRRAAEAVSEHTCAFLPPPGGGLRAAKSADLPSNRGLSRGSRPEARRPKRRMWRRSAMISTPDAKRPESPASTARRHFHWCLACVFLPVISLPMEWALALADWSASGATPEARRLVTPAHRSRPR